LFFLDLVSPDTNFPRKLFVIGRGIHRSSANGDILESTDWNPLELEDLSTWTQYWRLIVADHSIFLRGHGDEEIEIESNYERRSTSTPIEFGFVSICPDSPLLRRYNHFMIRPVIPESSQPRLVMELVPANVQSHCSTPMTYVDGIESSFSPSGHFHNRWMFNMVPRILTDDSLDMATVLESIPMEIDFDAYSGFKPNLTFEVLPWSNVVGPLIAHVELRSDARRVGNSGNTDNLRFENCTDYSIFPKILYSFYSRLAVEEKSTLFCFRKIMSIL
jgi:hypothetical protein